MFVTQDTLGAFEGQGGVVQFEFRAFDNGQFIIFVGARVDDFRLAIESLVAVANQRGPSPMVDGSPVMAHGALDLVFEEALVGCLFATHNFTFLVGGVRWRKIR